MKGLVLVMRNIIVLKGKLAEEDAAAKEREKLRDAMLRGEEIAVTNSGDPKPSTEVKPGDGDAINVQKGKLAEEDAAAKERKKLRDTMLRCEEIAVTNSGDPKPSTELKPGDGDAINVQKGKLAEEDVAAKARKKLREAMLRGEEIAITNDMNRILINELEQSLIIPKGMFCSIYWYENDRDLYSREVASMGHYFHQFKLQRLSDGRLSWTGKIKPKSVRRNAVWTLQLVYDHNHPSNSSWGGSVKVYSIDPDLEEIQRRLSETIPHLLTDPSGNKYLCTARHEDVKTGNVSTSAATSLAWAVKWIAVFEMLMAGDVTTQQFSSHTF